MERVIVVGAGPVGLMTALKLATVGIAVDVIEKNAELSRQPRAAGYHGAALAALKRTPVYKEAAKLGFSGNGICWRKPLVEDGEGGMKMGDIIASLPFASNEETRDDHGMGILYLPQSQLTELLYKAALQTGLVKVSFNRELSEIHQGESSVTAVVRNLDGGLEKFKGIFLVGADGGKSATRKILNIHFKGHSWPERLIAVDALLEDKHLDPVFPTSMVIHPVHFGLITPLEPVQPGKKTSYRCTIAVDPNDKRTDAELVSEENLMTFLDVLAPGPRPLDVKILNSSAYRTHQLCAFTMRKGRCLLAGDAAHLNNPFGALGLTTGLLDADAAADTLDLIINQKKPMDLLDLYSDERRRAFQTFVDPLSTQNKLRCANDPETAIDDWFLRALINKTPEIMEAFSRPFFDVWPTDMRKLTASKGL
ncbi:FAD/NAD(P)-binding domain-containing protein [Aspergillus caelatus]|uniref:FAD/NAD(P)-binding domain-containing protein n=1 Tax=Aspergillus caelatus TaxID=61420 RepID=A0A5N7A4R1_9EURO|nr:FAD/NAD(P)-binding domain-containing protein [Aspergillus caelatus]KAE8364851.1 FAD/NAD(P)-binding domain-containing protein [Aspergillus caelatus]